MTEAAAQVPEVAVQLGQLTDLFRRRLLEDKVARQALESQQLLIDSLRAELAGDHLVSLLKGLRLVIDRARAYQDESGFGVSIAEELTESLAAHGIEQIDELGPFDPSLHEAVESAAVQGTLVVERVVSVGFRKGARILLPARVAVTSASPE